MRVARGARQVSHPAARFAGRGPASARSGMPSEASAKEGSDERRATAFERYLKSGSGHAVANKRLW